MKNVISSLQTRTICHSSLQLETVNSETLSARVYFHIISILAQSLDMMDGCRKILITPEYPANSLGKP